MNLRNLLIKQDRFCIKEEYKCNKFLTPKLVNDKPSDVYELAYYLAEKSGVKYIIDIGFGSRVNLKKFENKYEIICIDNYGNETIATQDLKISKFIGINFEAGISDLIERDIIENSIVIFSNVIEKLCDPHKILKFLSDISYMCKFLLITTPERVKLRGIGSSKPPLESSNIREWSVEEFYSLLNKYRFKDFMIGYTNNNVNLYKDTILMLTGKNIYSKPEKKLKVLAVVNLFNEIDIIEEVITHLIKEGLDVKVVDNWSNDGSYEKVKQISEENHRVSVIRFPDSPPDFYEWGQLLKNTEKISGESEYDWIIHYDADEIRISPWKNVNLQEAISFIDSQGYNAIDFTILDFRPISEDNYIFNNSIEKSLTCFEFGKRPGHFVQVKAWKNQNNAKIDLATSGGHEVLFENRKVYPIKFITKHYPLRNKEQASKKIFQERVNRISNVEKEKGWHTQYNSFTKDDSFTWNRDCLIGWNDKSFYEEYIIERISGIGIVRRN
ncbi:glycosyltransferase family 2 protein [Clostridium sp. C2-6-12]|uniref:glycosyltransferase family 2 protein n=1 Tax=Clostridium sp. C2-6-12 TaxID=2698832 RepID=UPI00136FB4C6|nr:glycosyltransferase family 2 protein [Clostridium sp. C2-6-12]